MSCMTAAAWSGGNASRSRNDVTSCAQMKKGRRIIVRPGARNWRMVTIMFTDPTSDERISTNMPMSHAV